MSAQGVKEKKGERERMHTVIDLHVCSPVAVNIQGWARLKAGTQNSVHFSQVGGRHPSTGIMFICSSRYMNRHLDRKWNRWD